MPCFHSFIKLIISGKIKFSIGLLDKLDFSLKINEHLRAFEVFKNLIYFFEMTLVITNQDKVFMKQSTFLSSTNLNNLAFQAWSRTYTKLTRIVATSQKNFLELLLTSFGITFLKRIPLFSYNQNTIYFMVHKLSIQDIDNMPLALRSIKHPWEAQNYFRDSYVHVNKPSLAVLCCHYQRTVPKTKTSILLYEDSTIWGKFSHTSQLSSKLEGSMDIFLGASPSSTILLKFESF